MVCFFILLFWDFGYILICVLVLFLYLMRHLFLCFQTMVDLMGGQFSKPLVANRVTHLICYKFEGEKYELAKRMKRIKLVNHRWLEDW